MTAIRVAICNDFAEERWPSMDRVASMLHEQLRRDYGATVDAELVCPPFTRRLTQLPNAAAWKLASNADRFLNRFRDYPRAIARLSSDFDVFHIVDHSYAHLAHTLPATRTVVTCHDLDAFRSVLEPGDEPRSAAFRRKTREILSGLQRAACVTCDTAAIRDELVARTLVDPERLVVAPLGVSDRYSSTPDREADAAAAALIPPDGVVELLHVGSAAPRKRIDVLLRVCGAVARVVPNIRLIRVGDPPTEEQRQLARDCGLAGRIAVLDRVDEPLLAALYRRAALVLFPSEREGFGLPIIEGLKAGAPVVASDLAVLREVGGDAVEYCAVGDVDQWTAAVRRLLKERQTEPARWIARRERGIVHAGRFTWSHFAATLVGVYARLAALDDAESSTTVLRQPA